MKIITEPTNEQIAEIRKHLKSDAEIRPITWAPGYAVSAEGFVVSVRKWRREFAVPFRTLKTMRHSGGYPQVNLRVNGSGNIRTVHSLVAEAFLGPPPPPGAEVRHLDGDPENNAVGNLAWGSHAENMADTKRHGTSPAGERNGHAKVTESDIPRIRALFRHGVSASVIGTAFGLSASTVGEIGRGQTWGHVE